MASPLDPRKDEHPGTYGARYSEKEFTRLAIQDRMVTIGMGGVLSEQPDPSAFHRVLDVGCGTGGWLIEAAQTYPEMSLVGIDINQRLIEYARAQAEMHQVNDRVKFHVMDALLMLQFPVASFDLVNLRFSTSFMRTWNWSKLVSELLRVTHPGGVVRVTDGNAPHSNSPALTRLWEMLLYADYRAGHLFATESTALTSHLARLLDQYGCEQVQTKAHGIEYRAGTPEAEAFYEDMMLLFQTIRPFIQKWGCVSKDYDTIYQQALKEQYCELKAKRGEERTESSKSGILSERKKEGTFSCTDYGKWM